MGLLIGKKKPRVIITNNLHNACPMTTAKNLTTIATTETKRKRQEAIANWGDRGHNNDPVL